MTALDRGYIKRTIKIEGEPFSQDVLLDGTAVTVILAEPGAGKTELLKNLSASINGRFMRANHFRLTNNLNNSTKIVIDGLDEVSKIDNSAIDEIIVKAADLKPNLVFFASRAAQWEVARTKFIEAVFGMNVRVAYLHPLDEEEQKTYLKRINLNKTSPVLEQV